MTEPSKTFFKTNRKLSFSSHEKIKEFQLNQLKDHVRYCFENSPFYKSRFSSAVLNIDQLTFDRYSSLPLTSKSDLETRNDEFYAVPPEDIVDIVLSSGTTGLPTRIMYTESDLQRLAYNEEVSLMGCGITPSDIALLTCTIDRCFIAGLAYFSGLRNLGAAVIRNGQNTLESHTEIIDRLNPTVIVGVPSFLRKLGHFILDSGKDSAIKSIKKLVCIGEPIRDQHLQLTDTGQELEATWQANVYSTYASSESITSFCECDQGKGGHLLPDLAHVEIINDDGDPVPSGTPGEVVMTPLGISGMPLLRFKTGDISFLIDEPCECGRNSVRLAPILGRKAQMLKIKGTTLYPNAIFSVLESIEEIEEYYINAKAESDLSDTVTIHTALKGDSLTAENIENQLQARLRVKPKVIIEPANQIRQQVFNPSSRKPIRFFDKRKDQS